MPAISASAPGKTILFGEHAVVYGYPAIAVPLPGLELKVTIQMHPVPDSIRVINSGLNQDMILNPSTDQNQYTNALDTIQRKLRIDRLPAMQITISTNIPPESGLGSSAAFAVAMVRAVSAFLGFNLNVNQINEIAYEIEKFQHGTPSGIDNSVVAYQQPVFFQKDQPLKFIGFDKPLPIVLANSGIRSLTKESVARIRESKTNDSEFVLGQFQKIAAITMQAQKMIRIGNHHQIGKLMLENHQSLKSLGLSLGILDTLVQCAVQAGAFGAKLCGGGMGGNVVALIPSDRMSSVENALLAAGAVDCYSAVVKGAV